MRIVQKYGGTSLGDEGKIRLAARRMTGLARQGAQVVAVVSAQGQLTDELIEKAARVNRRGAAREMDAYLASGEQMSAALMAMAIGALGYPAVSLTGWQAGIKTDSVHGNGRIQEIDTGRILAELEKGRIVVVAGFQGISPEGDITGTPGSTPMPQGLGGSAMKRCWVSSAAAPRCSMTGAWSWQGTTASAWRFCPPLRENRERLWGSRRGFAELTIDS